MSGRYVRGSLRLAIYRRDSFACVYCDFKADPLQVTQSGTHLELELDHVEPRYRGGDSIPWNLMTCCLDCNNLKHSKGLDEFLALTGLDPEQVRRRIYLSKRRRLIRARSKSLQLMQTLKLVEESRCPWCTTTCEGCLDALLKTRLLEVTDGRAQGDPGEGEEAPL